MKGNKIIATLVVLAMVLSTLVVLNQLNINIIEKASATPGVDDWGLRTQVWTADLTYSTTPVDIIVDTTGLQARSYYLYFPDYDQNSGTYNVTWRPYYITPGYQERITVTTPGTNVTLEHIILNVSGIWAFNTTQQNGVISAHTADIWNNSANRWFWVNTSTTDSLTVSPDEVYLGNNQTITLTAATASGSTAATWFNVRRDNAEEPGIFLKKATGSTTFSSNWKSTLQWAGNYSVIAYRDLEETEPLYGNTGYENQGWNRSYGSDPAVSAGRYYYEYCGPFDPPEINSSYQTIRVLSGVPTTSIPEANQTVYWGFDGEVQIRVEDYNGDNLTNLKIYVYNSDEQNVTGNCTFDNASGVGYFNITNRNVAGATTGGWGRDANGNIVGENGTWYAYIFKDTDNDHQTQGREWADEWNTTVYFTVTNAPGVQWKWIDDDGGISTTDNNDGVIPMVPDIANQPLDITFQIIGEDHSYYGDAASADAAAPEELGENITVTGDALYLPTTLDKLPGVSYAAGTWTVPLTPLMVTNGGEITFAVDWEDYGSATESLAIGGKSLNGTIVTITPTEFTYGTDTTLTVTVKTAAGLAAYNAQVWLYWVGDNNGTLINNNNGILAYRNGGGDANGQYTFTINATQQKANQSGATIRGTTYKDAYGALRAPRNISAYVKLYKGTPSYEYGYALTEMTAQSNLKVTMEPSTVMAGQKVSKFWWNTTVVGATGNSTGYPEDTGLKVRIFNSTGDDVTTLIGSLAITDTDGDANQTATNKYLQLPGTYAVYAYNNTCNSEGHNATLIIQPVTVSCGLSELIWNVDDNVTATFTVTYNGQPINGTLRLDNITDNGTYNGTWYLTNFTPTIGSTAGTDCENTSIQITITNGVGTVHNITAENLWPASIARRNITYYFKSKTSGSAWAHADNILPVKIANVAVSKSAVPYNEGSELEITITGRGAGLPDVWVSVVVPGVSTESNGTTNADGKITFAVTPLTTGYIYIKVENRTSDTKVQVTSWKLYIVPVGQANEGETFTVTVRNGTASGDGLANVAVAFNQETKTTGADGTVTFTAPTVGTNGANKIITATKAGYKDASDTVQINNVPKLTIIQPSGKIYGTQNFVVTIANDEGAGVTGAKVNFNGVDYYSGANGVCELTAPDVKDKNGQNFTIGASFTGFTDATIVKQHIEQTKGVPGFELLTLVAAIGVAFLLLRRRRN